MAKTNWTVGDVVGLKVLDGGKKDYVVTGKGKKYGWFYVGRVGNLAATELVKQSEFIDKGRTINVPEDMRNSRNSCFSTNAKFKVGDRVNDHGTCGKIIEILKKNASGEQLYGFAPESGPAKGHSYEILEGKLSANSCVSVNAKFKVGDKVKAIEGPDYGYYPGLSKRNYGIVKATDGIHYEVEWKGIYGPETHFEHELALANSLSTNSVVANAMAARVVENGDARDFEYKILGEMESAWTTVLGCGQVLEGISRKISDAKVKQNLNADAAKIKKLANEIYKILTEWR